MVVGRYHQQIVPVPVADRQRTWREDGIAAAQASAHAQSCGMRNGQEGVAGYEGVFALHLDLVVMPMVMVGERVVALLPVEHVSQKTDVSTEGDKKVSVK